MFPQHESLQHSGHGCRSPQFKSLVINGFPCAIGPWFKANGVNKVTINPDQFSKCLADETRARLALLVAAEGELCVCELTCALDVEQPKISRHLALLRAGGVLADRRQGQWVYYRLHPQLPAWALQSLSLMHEGNRDWLAPNRSRLQAMADRPQRCC